MIKIKSFKKSNFIKVIVVFKKLITSTIKIKNLICIEFQLKLQLQLPNYLHNQLGNRYNYTSL